MNVFKHAVLPSYRFEVLVGGMVSMGFRSISGIKLSAAFEPLAVGGQNEAPVLLPVPVKDTGRLVMERGVSLVNVLEMLIPGMYMGEMLDIYILNELRIPCVRYSAAKPVVESVEISKLDAVESSVAIETLTVLHQGISIL